MFGGMETLQTRRSEDARPPSTVSIDLSSRLKFPFFFFQEDTCCESCFTSKRERERGKIGGSEWKGKGWEEKFVVYGAVGIDDAGLFFFYDTSDRNRDSSPRAKLSKASISSEWQRRIFLSSFDSINRSLSRSWKRFIDSSLRILYQSKRNDRLALNLKGKSETIGFYLVLEWNGCSIRSSSNFVNRIQTIRLYCIIKCRIIGSLMLYKIYLHVYGIIGIYEVEISL